MSDEQLIELVKGYPVLYVRSVSHYHDHNVRINAWEEIARKLHTTAENSKERWSKLRNCYASALKRRRKKSGQSASNILPWKYESQMNFVLPHMAARRKPTTLFVDIDDSTKDSVKTEDQFSDEPESPRSIATSPPPESFAVRTTMLSSPARTPTPTTTFHRTLNRDTKENDNNILKEIVHILESSQELRQKRMAEMDETDLFFLSMSKHLKKLPKIDRAKIKFQMHKLIHDAEINMITKNE